MDRTRGEEGRALAWVESPLQLLAAAEYAAARGTPIDVALRVGPQMASTAERLMTLRAPFARCTPFFGIPWSLLRSHRSWVIGDGFSGQFLTAMSVLRPRSVTLLDDGLMTIPLARSISGERAYHRPGHDLSARRAVLAALARDRLLALTARESLRLFTAFAGHGAVRALSAAGIDVHENGFAWLRANGRPIGLRGDAVVLGSASVVDGTLGLGDYLHWVRSATSDAAAPVSYLPHRRETRDILSAVAALPRVTIIPTRLPVELALAGLDRPLQIRTLPSTAAITLATILAGSGSRILTHTAGELVA